jgi:hypothetical protein
VTLSLGLSEPSQPCEEQLEQARRVSASICSPRTIRSLRREPPHCGTVHKNWGWTEGVNLQLVPGMKVDVECPLLALSCCDPRSPQHDSYRRYYGPMLF